MSGRFATVDSEAALEQTVRLGDCLPPDHLARFVVDVVAQRDCAPIYARYGARGGVAYAPEVLFGLLVSGDATGVCSTRTIARATDASAPFRYLAGNRHPDHDTLAAFRTTFLGELQGLFVRVLLLAQASGVLQLGAISLDGTTIPADAAKSKAVSDQRLQALERRLAAEVAALFTLGAQADRGVLPDGLVVADEIGLRQARLARLAEAQAVLAARARERNALEQAAYDAKVREREAQARRKGRPPRGRPPTPPTPGPRDKDQDNFTDPDSRIRKRSTDHGFDQQDNGQVAVEQGSLRIVGHSWSNHANDQAEVVPTVAAIPAARGTPDAAALDNGYFGEPNIRARETRGIVPSLATGREPQHQGWSASFAAAPAPPPAGASLKERMAYRLRTAGGKAIYRLRKCTVEPVIGIIKDVLGFRQVSLRGLAAAAGEWCVVWLACNLKRLHRLTLG